MTTRKKLHDHLMANKPEDASHPDDCDLCQKTPEGGAKPMSTYTQEDVQAAVDHAVETLVARVAELESAAMNSEVEAAVAAVKAGAAAKISELQDALDRAVLERDSAVANFDAFKADLETLEAARVETEAVAAREAARLEELRTKTSFSEEYLEANKTRFAAMSDEDFESRLVEYSALSAKKEPVEGSVIPKTALTAKRESTTTTTGMELIRESMRGSLLGADPRNL